MPPDRERRGDHAARHAHAGHSWDHVAARLAEVYDQSGALPDGDNGAARQRRRVRAVRALGLGEPAV
jgi:hypothetical protein